MPSSPDRPKGFGAEGNQKFAGETIRAVELFSSLLDSEEQAIELAMRFTELAVQMDEAVQQILDHPEVRGKYAVEDYEHFTIGARPGMKPAAHRLIDGMGMFTRLLGNTDEMALFRSNYDAEDYLIKQYEIFSSDLRYTKQRLENLAVSGSLDLTEDVMIKPLPGVKKGRKDKKDRKKSTKN